MDNALGAPHRKPLSTSSAASFCPPSLSPLSSLHHCSFISNQTEHTLAAMVRKEHEWLAKFPASCAPDIQFLLDHPSGQNLKTHHCMGVAYTHTFKTADHTRVNPHTLLAAEIALDMAEHLGLSHDDMNDIVAAVAGHDQGHIFASHVSEVAINSFPAFDGTPGRPHYCHERRTKELFDSDDFIRHFGAERIERIKSILYESKNPLHLLIDWSDRLAYLIADSLHLGHQDIIESSHVRQAFIKSLTILPDETIGFSSLEPVRSLINARDMLYGRVSIGSASALFTGFLLEAYHRAVAWQVTTPTEFVHLVTERTTPLARKLFHPHDLPRLYCPQQDPAAAKPVDLDYQAVGHVTLNMLSEKGRLLALQKPPVSTERTVPACTKPRAGMSELELVVRTHFSSSGGSGFLERNGAVIGISHMPPKKYPLRTLTPQGEVQQIEESGKEKWEFFVAFPKDTGVPIAALHREACTALINADLIQPSAVQRLQQVPPADFFTRY